MAATEPVQLNITPPSAVRLGGNAEYAGKGSNSKLSCLKATGANKLEGEQKITLLLTVTGTEALDVYNTFHTDGLGGGGERGKL